MGGREGGMEDQGVFVETLGFCEVSGEGVGAAELDVSFGRRGGEGDGVGEDGLGGREGGRKGCKNVSISPLSEIFSSLVLYTALLGTKPPPATLLVLAPITPSSPLDPFLIPRSLPPSLPLSLTS